MMVSPLRFLKAWRFFTARALAVRGFVIHMRRAVFLLFIPLAYMEMPTLDYELFTPSGKRGWIATWYAHEDDESMSAINTPYSARLVDETRIFISTSAPKGITRRWTMRLEGELKPREHDCLFEFGLTVAGRARVHATIFMLLLSH